MPVPALSCAVLTLVALSAASAFAGGTFEGHTVTLNVQTWDDPAQPIFSSLGRTVTIGRGVAFSMGPDHRRDEVNVAPVLVEIGPQRIAFSYGAPGGRFFDAAFNGYVLRFATDCALFDAVQIDQSATTLPIDLRDIRVEGSAMFINVAGRSYGPDATLALDVVVGDCLLG